MGDFRERNLDVEERTGDFMERICDSMERVEFRGLSYLRDTKGREGVTSGIEGAILVVKVENIPQFTQVSIHNSRRRKITCVLRKAHTHHMLHTYAHVTYI